jgi:hypothetical protein
VRCQVRPLGCSFELGRAASSMEGIDVGGRLRSWEVGIGPTPTPEPATVVEAVVDDRNYNSQGEEAEKDRQRPAHENQTHARELTAARAGNGWREPYLRKVADDIGERIG